MTNNFDKILEIKKLAKIFFTIFIFLLPIQPPFMSWILVLLFFLWIYENQFNSKWKFISNNKIICVLPVMYLLYLIGMIYSDNTNYGWQKIETKFGLIFFPIFLSTFRSIKWGENYSYYIKTYIYSILVTSTFCILRSMALFLYELYCRDHNILLDEYPYTNYFFSSYLAYFMHYGYYAMYVNVAIIFLYDFMLSSEKKHLYLLGIWGLSLFVLLLYSKAGMIANFIIHLVFVIRLIRKGLHNVFFIIVASVVLLGYILFNYIPYTKERIRIILNSLQTRDLDPNSTESTQLRIFAWKASIDLIKQNPVLGYGTGDVNDVLLNKYNEKKYYGALSKQINAHNQYLQTLLSIGLIGLMPLLVFFLWYLYVGIKFQNIPIMLFSIITLLAYAFESYLETQVGVFFTSIFPFLFLKKFIDHFK